MMHDGFYFFLPASKSTFYMLHVHVHSTCYMSYRGGLSISRSMHFAQIVYSIQLFASCFLTSLLASCISVNRDALKCIGRAQPGAHTARPRLDGGPGTRSPPLAAPATSCSSRDTGLTASLAFFFRLLSLSLSPSLSAGFHHRRIIRKNFVCLWG